MTDTRNTARPIDASHPLLSPGAETDNLLIDVAKKAAMSVLVTMLREHDDNAEAPEAAVRALLLAAAELRWDITIGGRGTLVSTMLLAGLDELRDDMVLPHAPIDQAVTTARLRAAAAAGLRGDAAPSIKPLIVPRGMGDFTRGLLAACAPPPRCVGDDDDAPPLAAA